VLEKIIATSILEFCLNNGVFKNQFGFLPYRSAAGQLLRSFDFWTNAIDNRNPFHTVYLDFARAFDRVSHEKLLFRLYHIGIRQDVLGWIRSFLSGRMQRVRVDSSYSSYCNVTSGVPQGSVLGPLLFAIFIDTLSECINGDKLWLFADDSEVSRVVKTTADFVALQGTLDRISSWTNTWQLPLAENKCQVLAGGKGLAPNYSLNGVPVAVVNQVTHLGVECTDTLCFSIHCAKLAAKGHQKSYILRKCFPTSDAHTLVKVFKTYVRPIVEYCSVIWSPYLKKDIEILENVQRKFTKSLPGMKNKSYDERLSALSLDSLELRRIKIDLITCFRLLRGEMYQGEGESILGNILSCRTRGHDWRFGWPKARLNCRHHFFVSRVGRIWNKLPAFVVDAPSVHSFKHRLSSVNLKIYCVVF